METIEYRDVVDKSAWPRGPWDKEPDKVQWRDEATGMACLILRGPHGALCGYVGVEPGHPWHGEHYDNIGSYSPKPDGYDESWYPDVHGGLTYADGCSHGKDPSQSICHVPGEGEPDDVWWLGFDCAHCEDFTPSYSRPERGDTYRGIDYVRKQIEGLAKLAKNVA